MMKKKRSSKILLGCASAGLLFALLFLLGVWSFFSRLMPGYEVVDGHVYYRSFNNLNWKVQRKELDGADPSRIETLRRSGGNYASDGAMVFFKERSITLADPNTFEVLDWRQEFARDSSHAFWGSIKLSDDPDHFQVLTQGYSKDRQHVYYSSWVVDQADPSTFIVDGTTSSNAHDKNHRYLMGKKQPHPKTTAGDQQSSDGGIPEVE